MKRKLSDFSERYRAALRSCLKHGPRASLEPARGMLKQAMDAGLPTLELAKLHERTLVADLLPGLSTAERKRTVRQAAAFFAVAITPMAQTEQKARGTIIPGQFKKFIEKLSQRTVELAASNLELNQQVDQRKTAEKALRKSERHYAQLLEQSDGLQEQLRRLSRQVLSTQEEERKKISRELHDVIAQTLTGINIRLASLKSEAAANTEDLQDRISSTQRLVEQAVDIVHRFARELRPAVLDDLGLIPALHTFLKSYQEDTGIRVSLSASSAVEQLGSDKRTILFRVAQEALNNVSRHAQASEVEVKILKTEDIVSLQVKDDGKGFPAERVMLRKRQKRLGLLGMRERLEMVRGTLAIQSNEGKGTLIIATIPFAESRFRKPKSLNKDKHQGANLPNL